MITAAAAAPPPPPPLVVIVVVVVAVFVYKHIQKLQKTNKIIKVLLLLGQVNIDIEY
jgi:hypothetical protein